MSGDYVAIEVKASELKSFISSCGPEWIGFSLTMPLKEEALLIADQIDPLVRRIASGNTLVRSDGRWALSSTDVTGFQAALFHNGVTSFSSVLIIGSGATARAVAAACDRAGAEITVVHRSPSRETGMNKSVTKASIKFMNWDSSLDLHSYDLVVNTTPAGVADIFADKILNCPSGFLFDVIYSPWPTMLAAQWPGAVIPGIELLIFQAIDQVALMLNREIDRPGVHASMRAAIEGMPK